MLETMSRITEEGLQNPSALQGIPKSDLHNYAGRGGSLAYISKCYGVNIDPPQRRFSDLAYMQGWFEAQGGKR